MTPQQKKFFVNRTNYLIEKLEPELEDLKEHGMTNSELKPFEKFLDSLAELNKKYQSK